MLNDDYSAMENWGMVTYKEDMLIYEEDVTNIAHRQRFDGVTTIGKVLILISTNFYFIPLFQLMSSLTSGSVTL